MTNPRYTHNTVAGALGVDPTTVAIVREAVAGTSANAARFMRENKNRPTEAAVALAEHRGRQDVAMAINYDLVTSIMAIDDGGPLPGEELPGQVREVPVPAIVPSRWQPRMAFDEEALLELAKHIKAHGLMYPVILFVNEDGEHELVAGERRVRAIAGLGLTRCPAFTEEHGQGLRKAIGYVAANGWAGWPFDAESMRQLASTVVEARLEPSDDHQRLHELAVADNIQRRNLSAVEEARALQGLIDDHELTQREVAARIGWSQSKVQERLALLNMAPEVHEAMTARAVGPSHARHIARLPEEVQPAVTEEIKAMIDRDGDQSATVRQVASMVGQLRKFLEVDRWTPPEGELLKPWRRNMLRLVRALLPEADLEAQARHILTLREHGDRWSKTNLLGKKPENLATNQLRDIVAALTGKPYSIDEAWLEVAQAEEWTCRKCLLVAREKPDPCGERLPCARMTSGEVLVTCPGWIGRADPFVIEVDHDLARWAGELGKADAVTREPFLHCTDYELWKEIVEQAEVARVERQAEVQDLRQNAHLVALAAYWAQQQAGGLFAEAEDFQAHRCERCINYRADLLDQELPPCGFAEYPIQSKHSDEARAPDFGVLVAEDGAMAPRCKEYRWLDYEISGLPGFCLPDRAEVLEWLRAAVKVASSGGYGSSHAMAGVLAWLPYPGREPGKGHDLANLLRFLKRRWDDLGDESMATLFSVAVSEARALSKWQGALELMDPTTGEAQAWAAAPWDAVLEGQRLADHRYRYVGDAWPQPWVTEE